MLTVAPLSHSFFKYLEDGGRRSADSAAQIMRSTVTRTASGRQQQPGSPAVLRAAEEVEAAAAADIDRNLQVYDLKGSWVNRSVLQSGQTETRETRKDNDLREKFYLSEAEEKKLNEQLVNDSKFLCDNGLMDYSLLVGVRKTHTAMHATAGDGATSDGRSGFTAAATLPVANKYYMGIIDILQEWDWSKRAEQALKGLGGQDIAGVSCIPPEEYRIRFVDKMRSHIEGVVPAQAWGQGVMPRQLDAATGRQMTPQSSAAEVAAAAFPPTIDPSAVRAMVRDMATRLQLEEADTVALEQALATLNESGRAGSGLCRWLEKLPRNEFVQAVRDMQVTLGGDE